MNERIPQRFKFRKYGWNEWEFGVCMPQGQSWQILAGKGFGSFYECPWEMMGAILGDVADFAWIDNDHGWHGGIDTEAQQ